MDEDIKWLFGTILAFVGIIGGAIARDRAMMSKIEQAKDQMRKDATRIGNELHERVNSVKDQYVRRVDLDAHVGRIERGMEEMREDAKEHSKDVNTRLDNIITQLSNRNGK